MKNPTLHLTNRRENPHYTSNVLYVVTFYEVRIQTNESLSRTLLLNGPSLTTSVEPSLVVSSVSTSVRFLTEEHFRVTSIKDVLGFIVESYQYWLRVLDPKVLTWSVSNLKRNYSPLFLRVREDQEKCLCFVKVHQFPSGGTSQYLYLTTLPLSPTHNHYTVLIPPCGCHIRCWNVSRTVTIWESYTIGNDNKKCGRKRK